MISSRLRLLLIVLSIAILSITAAAQAVLTTLQVGSTPDAVAVNSTTNKIYVANVNDGTVTVIDGATNNTTSVLVGSFPDAIAVNSLTNKIYVASRGGAVTVIDGATNNTISVTVGRVPLALAINLVTNKIYVANRNDNTVTVIDGATNNTQTVAVGNYPIRLAVNSITNKIYVVNYRGNNVTVIDGATNNTTSIGTVGCPSGIDVNSVTNKIYVANKCASSVTVIDGSTNNTTTVTVGYFPTAVGVDPVANKIYVVNACAKAYNNGYCFTGSVSVIDGSTNSTLTIPNTPDFEYISCQSGYEFCPAITVDSQAHEVYVAGSYPDVLAIINETTLTVVTLGLGDLPSGLALNPATNRIYVANEYDNTVSIIDRNTALQFVPVTPCRVVDTRNPNGRFGGPPIQGGEQRDFPLPLGSCHIPSSAVAYALNVTVVPHGGLGYITVWPTSQLLPNTSTLNSLDGRVKADAAIVQGGINGSVNVYASDTTDVILDINGYFTPATSSTLAFFPLSPCRVVDTRGPNGDLGGPALTGGVPRTFPLLEATDCNIPSTAQAYSLNFTVVPPGPLGYLTVWPAGQNQPQVSTLNAPTGTVVANAAVVPAGDNGAINAFANRNTNLIVDINGYFAPAGSAPNPLSFYTLQSCRILDTRSGSGGEFSGQLVIDAVENRGYCGASDQAQAYVFNATVIPVLGRLNYLALWPDGEQQPTVSTLNALDGAITSNMAIVPDTGGLIDAYATELTHLLLDVSGYFAP